MTGATLNGADLTDAQLEGAVFTDAELRGTDLSRADLTGADLSRALLVHARLDDVRYSEASRWPPGWDPAEHISSGVKTTSSQD